MTYYTDLGFCFVSRIHGSFQAQAIFQAHDIKPFPVFLEI